MAGSRFSWLHFTDLHTGVGEALWPNVEEMVLKDVEQVLRHTGPIHAVFFTGDLTHRGTADQFTKFNEVWDIIRSRLSELGCDPVFLAVPGNHDLVRPDKTNAAPHRLLKWTEDDELRSLFWSDSHEEYRAVVGKAFQNWTEWSSEHLDWKRLKEVHNEGWLPGDFAGTLEVEAIRIGVLGLNSAALQLDETRFEKRLSLDVKQANALLPRLYKWVNKHDACFLLTHHDPTWLHKEGLKAYYRDIAVPGRFVLHLCGHHHRPTSYFLCEGGAEPRRTIIGPSLYGMKFYLDGEKKEGRVHGYCAGVIDFGSTRTLRRWPRRDAEQTAGHFEIKADPSEALQDDDGTATEDLGPSPRSENGGAGDSAPPIEDSPLVGWTEITSEFLDSRRSGLTAQDLKLFYDGQEPGWRHALADAAQIPRREIVARAIEVLESSTSQTMILLVGAGGEGKSTAIRQIAAGLVSPGRRVLLRDAGSELNPEALPRLPAGSSWTLVSDDADEIAGNLEQAITRVQSADRTDVHWVLAARDTDWKARFRRGKRNVEPAWEQKLVVWPERRTCANPLGLTESDARAVVSAWDSAGCLGELGNIDESQRAEALVTAAARRGGVSDGTFFGGILEKRFGAAGLTAHVETLLKRLGDDDHRVGRDHTLLEAFLYAAAADAVGIDGVDLKVVAFLLGVDLCHRRTQILNPLGREAAAGGAADALRTRHPAIAKAAIQLVESSRVTGDLEETFKGLVRGTGELGREGGVDVSHGAIMNCGPTLIRQLRKLIAKDRAIHIARRVADEAEKTLPHQIRVTVSRANTYRGAGMYDQARQFMLRVIAASAEEGAENRIDRALVQEVAVIVGLAGQPIEGLWLCGVSVSDELMPESPSAKQTKLSLGSLGEACKRINALEGKSPYARALRATSVLGSLANPQADQRATECFRGNANRADELSVPSCSGPEALDWLQSAVAEAALSLATPELVALRDRLAGTGARDATLHFEGLRKVLGLQD